MKYHFGTEVTFTRVKRAASKKRCKPPDYRNLVDAI